MLLLILQTRKRGQVLSREKKIKVFSFMNYDDITFEILRMVKTFVNLLVLGYLLAL